MSFMRAEKRKKQKNDDYGVGTQKGGNQVKAAHTYTTIFTGPDNQNTCAIGEIWI